MKTNRKLIVLFVVAVLAVVISACGTATAQVTKKQVELTFVFHLAAEMPEQDVFVAVEGNDTSTSKSWPSFRDRKISPGKS